MTIRLSPTRAETYLECPTKWAFQNFPGFELPPTPQQEIGTLYHAWAEKWLTGTELPPSNPHPSTLDEIALELFRAATVALQDARGRVECEVPVEIWKTADWTAEGRVDAVGHRSDGWLILYDHKTISNESYVPSPSELWIKKLQPVVYAYGLLQKYPDAGGVDFRWVYTPKARSRRPQRTELARTVTWDLSRELISKAFFDRKIVETWEEMMYSYRKYTHPLQLAKNSSACGNYGGCPFQGECWNGRENDGWED